MTKREQRKRKTELFIIDKVIWTILTPVLKPIVYILEFFSSKYEITERQLMPNEPCFCNSKKRYKECHLPENKKKGKIAVKITKTYFKSRRKIVKYKVKVNEKWILSGIRPGIVNPLNKNRNFVDTSGYDSL